VERTKRRIEEWSKEKEENKRSSEAVDIELAKLVKIVEQFVETTNIRVNEQGNC